MNTVRRLLVRAEVLWIAAGSALTTVLAAIGMTSEQGLGHLLTAPMLYSKDAVSAAAAMKATIEGNPFLSARLGYPFGANWLDLPSLDWGILGVARAISLFTHDYVLVFNLLFLLGFPAAFLAAFVVARRFDVSRAFAFVVGISYALASYHFERVSLQGHLFLTWYWVAPVFILLGWRLVAPVQEPPKGPVWLRWLGLAALTGFGVYYTAFGLITITAGLLLAIVMRAPRAALTAYLRTVLPLLAGVALQLAPTFVNALQHGMNPLAITRSRMESEIYALRLEQLVLPHLTHRIPSLAAKAADFYNAVIPGNESVISSIGVIALLGLFVLVLLSITAVAGQPLDDRFRYLTTITFTFIAFATVGGLGLMLSLLGFTGIRSWNRLSIFIEFAALLATAIALAPTAQRYSRRVRKLLTPVVLVLILGVVWVDQTPAPCPECVASTELNRTSTSDFVHTLERRLPSDAAVYQLPYVAYPEGWRLRTYDAYEFMKPYLESTSLRFNLGGIRGRSGDRFYRSLAQRAVATQVDVVRRLGFSGIYVDRSGFADGGMKVVTSLIELLGPSSATWRNDHRVVYFDLHNDHAPVATGSLSPAETYQLAGFVPSFPKRHLSR